LTAVLSVQSHTDRSASPAAGDASVAPSSLSAKESLSAEQQEWDETLSSLAADPDARASTLDAKQRAQHEASAAASGASESPGQPNAGIRDDAGAPASSMDFQSVNYWGGKVGGRWWQVWAGRAGNDPDLGRLLVMNEATGSGSYVDLKGSGELRIVKQVDDTLVIEGADGATHVFDVATGSWAT